MYIIHICIFSFQHLQKHQIWSYSFQPSPAYILEFSSQLASVGRASTILYIYINCYNKYWYANWFINLINQGYASISKLALMYFHLWKDQILLQVFVTSSTCKKKAFNLNESDWSMIYKYRGNIYTKEKSRQLQTNYRGCFKI